MVCLICESERRHQIDVDLLSGTPIEEVFEKYQKVIPNLTLEMLKVHAVCHVRMTKPNENEASFATKIAFSEMHKLNDVCDEYLATLQQLGTAINNRISAVDAGDERMKDALTKPLVDLYLGTGLQIRETIKLLKDTYMDMNADENMTTNKSGLIMLSGAIERSRKKFGGREAV